MEKEINLLDLFSGIGGFTYGIEQAGFKIKNHFHSEIDKFANAIYAYHYPNAIQLGSVESIRGKDLPHINIITFGFPCQDLSIAGKRNGLAGCRSGLFFEAMRLVDECRPDYFIAENVKGLLSSNGGRDFVTVLRTICELGVYHAEWQLLNSKDFGVPQNRERVFIVGHLGGGSGRKVFPIQENSGEACVRVIGTTVGKDCTRFGTRDKIIDRGGLMGCLKATDYKQPPQILSK